MNPRKRAVFATIALMALVGSLLVGVAPAAASGFFDGAVVRAPDAEAEMLDTINRTRAVYGLPALANRQWGGFEPYLDCIANQNASEAALMHYPPSCNQSIVEAEILAARYSSSTGGSTNLLVQQWNNSDGHRRLMLAADADYAYVGVYCIGNTSWAIAWIGENGGSITQNNAPKQSVDAPFFTDNDYNCRNGTPVPINDPVGVFVPADSLEDLINRPDFDRDEADILRLYRAFFRRDAKIDGANYWLEIRANGASIDQISYQFAASEEFTNTYGSVNNRQYLEILYLNILDRNPDGEGFNYWLGLLNNGDLNRGGVVRWIAANDEFINRHRYGGY